MTPSLDLELPARLEHLPSARQAIAGVCASCASPARSPGTSGWPCRRRRPTACCTPPPAAGRPEATIALSARVDGGMLEVVVADFVGGLVRGSIGGGGRGSRMRVVRSLADWSDIASSPSRGLRIAMRFALPEQGEATLPRAA
jgi:hypothetical protein